MAVAWSGAACLVAGGLVFGGIALVKLDEALCNTQRRLGCRIAQSLAQSLAHAPAQQVADAPALHDADTARTHTGGGREGSRNLAPDRTRARARTRVSARASALQLRQRPRRLRSAASWRTASWGAASWGAASWWPAASATRLSGGVAAAGGDALRVWQFPQLAPRQLRCASELWGAAGEAGSGCCNVRPALQRPHGIGRGTHHLRVMCWTWATIIFDGKFGAEFDFKSVGRGEVVGETFSRLRDPRRAKFRLSSDSDFSYTFSPKKGGGPHYGHFGKKLCWPFRGVMAINRGAQPKAAAFRKKGKGGAFGGQK